MSINLMTIRPYQTEDLEACRSLWVELTDWHRTIYQSPGIGGSDPGRQFDAHLGHVGPENIWVAEVDGQPEMDFGGANRESRLQSVIKDFPPGSIPVSLSR